jgi:predicted alpha/beta-hydrolase family hydrolase
MEERLESPEVQGTLHRPEHPNGRGIVLTHGAGSNKDGPVLTKLARAFEGLGYTVLRYNLPFRRLRASGSPNPSNAAKDREGVRQAVAAMRAIVKGALVAGGHSYGGRQTAMAAAEAPGLDVSSLALFSYPLHPPGQPQKLRTDYFPGLKLPVLFVHGTKDPFGAPDELRAHVPLIPAATHIIEIPGGAHDLKRAPEFAQEIVERMLF